VAVGDAVGPAVGPLVGLSVGASVGRAVGFFVGAGVTAIMCITPLTSSSRSLVVFLPPQAGVGFSVGS